METSRGIRVRQEHIYRVKQKVKLSGFARQQDLVDEVQISRDTVNRFLNGKPVSYLNFIELSGALGLDWKEIAEIENSQSIINVYDGSSSSTASFEMAGCDSTALVQFSWNNQRPEIVRSFQTIIEKKTEAFIGRDYVFQAIDNFFTTHPCGYFTVKAKPGVGKSSIIAEYVRRNNCIAYFNVRSEGINRAEQFLESICIQLIERYSLNYPSLPAHATQDGGFLSQLLEQIAEKTIGESVVIAIDALDEVDLTSQSSGANVLYLPQYLPNGIYILVSQRSDVPLPFDVKSPQDEFDLMSKNCEEAVSQDIQEYLYQFIKRERTQKWIQLHNLSNDEFTTQLTRKSEFNFMYLSYVLKDIETGKYQDLSIEKLPIGLEGYYESHWQSMGMMERPLPKSKIKIIYVLVEVGRPVSSKFISEVSKEGRLTVQEVLDDWKQFLLEQNIENQKCYSVYHASFTDFLHRKDIVQSAEVKIDDIDTLIVDTLWEGIYGNE